MAPLTQKKKMQNKYINIEMHVEYQTPRKNSHLLIGQPVCYDAFKVYILSVYVFPDDLSIVSATSYTTGMEIKTT